MHVRGLHHLLCATSELTIPLSDRFNDAMATIRRVPSIEHNFQLVITRVYEEGDQELLEDEEESASFADRLYPVLTLSISR